MIGACSTACGPCGACTAAWERETTPRTEFFCIVCGVECELDDFEPFCSEACRDTERTPNEHRVS